jgi:protoporphyrinogen oxidase
MQQIPEQLAAGLSPGSVRLRTRVATIANRLVVTETGESILADAVVVATDGDAAARLVPDLLRPPTRWTGTTQLCFVIEGGPHERSLLNRPVLILCAAGPINTIVSMSDVSPGYSASGRSLVYVSLIGTDHGVDAAVEAAVRAQLQHVLGDGTRHWRLLRLLRIPHSLPDQTVAAMSEVHKRIRLRQGLYVCGDHVDQASLNGAMCAGRRAAEAILRDFGPGEE